jgi:hypothetical protein
VDVVFNASILFIRLDRGLFRNICVLDGGANPAASLMSESSDVKANERCVCMWRLLLAAVVERLPNSQRGVEALNLVVEAGKFSDEKYR